MPQPAKTSIRIFPCVVLYSVAIAASRLLPAGQLENEKKYPYYLCDTKGCASHRKSIPRAKIEGDFEEIVKSLQPAKGLFEVAKAMFRDAWGQRKEQATSLACALKQEKKDIEKQMEGLLENIMSASSQTVIKAY